MERWVVRTLAAAPLIALVASPCLASDGLSGGVGCGLWRFTAPSPNFETLLDGAPTTITVSLFGQYRHGPYVGGLRIGYVKKELPNGFRETRGMNPVQVVVNDPSSLRLVPITLEIGRESRGHISARAGVCFGFAGVWHQFLPSAFVHEAAEDKQEVDPVFRIAGGVSTHWGRALLGVDLSYLTLLSAEDSISKMQAEVLHGVALELRVGLH
jgi:hypothetical protein